MNLVQGSNAFRGVRAEIETRHALRSRRQSFTSDSLPQFERVVRSFSIAPLCSPDLRENRNAAFLCHRSNRFIYASRTSPCRNESETYRCWAEIDRSALRHNAKIVRERVGSAEILAVVKANAYGHGLIGVAETLADDAQLFGVANLEEALALRESFSHPIIILGPALPGKDRQSPSAVSFPRFLHSRKQKISIG